MAQIGFTAKTEHIYDRFNKMRRDYVEKHGRTYAPDFLTVLMDAFSAINQLNAVREEWVKRNPKDTASFVIEPGENGEVQFWRIEEDAPGQERWTELLPPVSLRSYIADAEANDPNLQPVRIKDSNNHYIEKVIIATTNLFMTPYRDLAMVFNRPDEAKAFLRRQGRSVEGWILEPANEMK